MPRVTHTEQDFWDRVMPEPNTGCWLWVGTYNGNYGMFNSTRAHRWSYEKFIGPIPKDMVIDHVCKLTCCVNPVHLEVVTQRENGRRGPVAHRQVKYCKRGHDEWTVRPNGERRCRACARLYWKNTYTVSYHRRTF